MLIHWLNDDQRLEQAEPRWSPRGKRCSPSSWESVQTRSKQIVRKINIRGSGRGLVWRSKAEAGVRCAWREVSKPGALLGQFKRSDVFTAELCPGMKEVQAEVTAALVNLVISKIKKNIIKKSVLVQTWTSKDLIHGQRHGCVFGRRPSHQLIWVSKERGFSFECQNTLRGSYLFIALFFGLTPNIPTRPLTQVPTLAGRFGNLRHSSDPDLKTQIWVLHFHREEHPPLRNSVLSCKCCRKPAPSLPFQNSHLTASDLTISVKKKLKILFVIALLIINSYLCFPIVE